MRDSLGNLPTVARSTELLDSTPKRGLAKPRTFGASDALALVGRLVTHWPKMAEEQGSESVLAREYELQFKGYDPALVEAAVTEVIGASTFAPKPGELKAAVRAEFTRRHGHPERYRAPLPKWEWKPPTPEQIAEVTEAVDRFLKRGRYAVAKPVEHGEPQSIEDDVADFRRKHAAAQALVEG